MWILRRLAWASSVSAGNLLLSAITVLELETGVLLVERRDPVQGVLLRSWMEAHVPRAFKGRILAIDSNIAQRCARLHVPNRCAGRDALIAATALVHGMTVVTRNTVDFEATGAVTINPWHKL